MKLRQLYLSLLLSVTAILSANAQTDNKTAYRERQYLGNVAYGSLNPVSESYMPITDIADIRVDYDHTDGDLHRIDDAGSTNSWLVSFSGMKKVGKVVFSGGLIYDNTVQNDRRWNNTLFVSRYNPYIIGDSILSKFNRETFKLDGTAVYTPTKRLRLGLRARYDVGSSATQKDPRPDIKGMRFSLNPGAEYSLGRNALGLSAHVGWLSEESSTTVVKTTTKQYVFLFQGLGVYETKDAVGYRRRYNGMDYGASLQFTFNTDSASRISDFIEAAYTGAYENAIDGTSATRYKGGRYMGSGLSLSNRLSLRSGERTIHNITLSGMVHNTTGRWYTQKVTTDQSGNLTYEVVNESEYYKGNTLNISAGYRFDLLDGTLPVLSASLDAAYNHNETKNRLYGARQEYSRIDISAEVTRRFRIRDSRLGISLRGLYSSSPNHSINLSGMPTTYSIIIGKYTRPAYDYLITGYYGAGGSATYTLPLNMLEYDTLLNITVGADYRKASGETSQVYRDTDRLHVYGSIGFVF